jgi:hypothetical protein
MLLFGAITTYRLLHSFFAQHARRDLDKTNQQDSVSSN